MKGWQFSGKRGGKARAEALSKKECTEIQEGVAARWKRGELVRFVKEAFIVCGSLHNAFKGA
jgi:hypothetical protein